MANGWSEQFIRWIINQSKPFNVRADDMINIITVYLMDK